MNPGATSSPRPKNAALWQLRKVSSPVTCSGPGQRCCSASAMLDLPAELRTVIGLHPREAVRVLADAVLDAAGPTLADDATLLIVDWYGDHPQLRRTGAGADPVRASPPLPG